MPVCITARASRTCRDACQDRLPSVAGKTFPTFPAHAHPQFCVSGKRPMGSVPIHARGSVGRGPCLVMEHDLFYVLVISIATLHERLSNSIRIGSKSRSAAHWMANNITTTHIWAPSGQLCETKYIDKNQLLAKYYFSTYLSKTFGIAKTISPWNMQYEKSFLKSALLARLCLRVSCVSPSEIQCCPTIPSIIIWWLLLRTWAP